VLKAHFENENIHAGYAKPENVIVKTIDRGGEGYKETLLQSINKDRSESIIDLTS